MKEALLVFREKEGSVARTVLQRGQAPWHRPSPKQDSSHVPPWESAPGKYQSTKNGPMGWNDVQSLKEWSISPHSLCSPSFKAQQPLKPLQWHMAGSGTDTLHIVKLVTRSDKELLLLQPPPLAIYCL